METSLRYGGDSTALRVNTNKKAPIVRYAGDTSGLKVHAKQKFRIDSNTLLQLDGELDTRIGAPTFFTTLLSYLPPEACENQIYILLNRSIIFIFASCCLLFFYRQISNLNGELDTRIGAPTFFTALLRYFPPELSAKIGAGVQYDRRDNLHYTLRGKKAFPLTDRFVNFVVKGRCDLDKDFKQPTPSGAAELVWNILDFQKDQDVRLKVGYEIVDKIPYVQVRENNWTFTANANGKWNVKYNL